MKTITKISSRNLKKGVTYNIELPTYYGGQYTERTILSATYTGRDYAGYCKFEYKNGLGRTVRTCFSTKIVNDSQIEVTQ